MILQLGDKVIPPIHITKRRHWWRIREYEVVVAPGGSLGIYAEDGDFYDIARMELNGYLTESSKDCFRIANFSLENE